MKTTIATPMYGGQNENVYTRGMIEAYLAGLVQDWLTITTESLVPRARNQLASLFLGGETDTLVFIDADIGFRAEHLRQLLSHNKGIVSGMYRKKTECGGWVYNEPYENEGDVMAVKECGTGFLAIKREVLECIRDNVAKPIKTDSGATYWDFFPTGCIEDDRYLSEDYGFCYLARQCGYKVWVDTQIQLQHVGRKVYQ